jgi:putative polyketide hydroxylase
MSPARHPQYDAPVAIIGGSVVGLSTALALSRQGVDSIVLERASEPNAHPRAHVANPRTLELFRLWGVEDAVRAAGLPPEAAGNFIWMSSIAGERLGEIRYDHGAAGSEARQSVTLTPEVSCAQDVIERILRQRLVDTTGRDVRFDANVVAVETEAGSGVTLRVDRDPREIRARYAVAADGAGSPTRKRLGIGMEGDEELAQFVSIYLHADLSKLTSELPAVLYWIVNPEVQGVFISMDGRKRYVFHVRMDPSRERAEDFTVERCQALLRAAIGSDDVDVDVVKVGHWLMSGQLAERYRQDDVFLVGDSAHRFPPTGGFGMNTGAQDAHNLAWKMAAVLSGWADDSLLDTYEPERRPIAHMNSTRSVANFRRLKELASWSLDPLPIIERLSDAGETGRHERARFAAEIESQREHFDKIVQELGFVYREGALIPDGHLNDADERWSYVDAEAVRQARVGARMPLVRLRRADGTEVATTDMFEREFVLLANGGSGEWEAALPVLKQAGIPASYYEIGRDLLAPAGAWDRVSGTEPGGLLVVRPDGHLAYRAPTACSDAPSRLRGVFERILRDSSAVPAA